MGDFEEVLAIAGTSSEIDCFCIYLKSLGEQCLINYAWFYKEVVQVYISSYEHTDLFPWRSSIDL